ncbi:MAG: DUF6455 family protein [Hyphomicrobiaceae bacterium]
MDQGTPILPMADRVWHLADLLDRMIGRVGVAGTAGRVDGGEGLRQAAKTCLLCDATVMCERFLAARDIETEIPSFCPNRQFLLRCRELPPPR